MDRHRGSGYRNPSSSNYSSSDYSGRNFDNNNQHRRSQGDSLGWSGERNPYSAPKEYEKYSSSERGTKRRYEQSGDHKKSYDQHSHNQDPHRKYHRSDGSHSFEGRSNHLHHRPQYEQSSSSSRGRNYSYENNRSSSHDHDSNSQRRFNDNRRYQQRGASSSGGHRGNGGFISSRGRGRGRGANRNHGAGSQHSKNKNYQSEKNEDSSSPNRLSIAEESACASDVPSVSPSRQPPENNVDATSDKIAAVHSESDKSTREEKDHGQEREIKIKQDPDATADESVKTDDDQHSRTEETGRKSENERSPKRKTTLKEFPEHFIRLQCPHCNQRSITFREYIVHLSSPRHAKSLEKISLQHRMSLAKLRTRQRKEQSQIEAQTSRSSHRAQMNFCAICKLCHSESRPNHETTELHKIIKNFLMPYCPICRVNFKSRMLYEKHVATLTHIKNKVNMEKSYERRREEERKHDRNGFEKDELVLDLENFMTLDAVGSVDGDAENGVSLEETAVGQECVKKVEAFFCDVCQRYLSRVEPLEKGLEFHCRTRSHHRAYEEHQNGHKEFENCAENEDGTEKELKRSESQELLLVEAEKDIGEICDLIGDDDQTPEEEYGGQASGEESRNAEEADEKNQEHSEATEITTNEDDYEKDDLSTN
ncbi:uncharacterized protein LOC124343190 isoform X2 [Daphnia pulicaria]|uniref:uncharacterized protein LOC124343190 isoform X2 n=1 Tax=Daphnia pulicaria TaxID=35523 RepID=UPI001EEBF134|nr:uncharacterized protein LOC124343190 isoform X2 [Daphnia pulicaria]